MATLYTEYSRQYTAGGFYDVACFVCKVFDRAALSARMLGANKRYSYSETCPINIVVLTYDVHGPAFGSWMTCVGGSDTASIFIVYRMFLDEGVPDELSSSSVGTKIQNTP